MVAASFSLRWCGINPNTQAKACGYLPSSIGGAYKWKKI